MEEKQKKRKGGVVRTCVFLVCLAVLIVAVAVIAGKGNVSGVKDFFPKGDEEAAAFYYEASGNAVFESVGDSLAVLSSSDLTVYDESGAEKFREYCYVSTPAIASAGDYAVAYDIGGQWMCFFGEEGAVKTITEGEKIISATVDENGFFAVCTEDSGYFGAVEIYNSKGEAVYRWRSGTAYVLTARAGDNGFSAAVLGRGGSRVVNYALDSTDEKGSFSTDELIIDIARFADGAGAITQNGIIYLDGSGQETARYDFSGRFLERYALTDEYAVLVTGESQLTTQRDISIVEQDGAVSASIRAEGDVMDIHARGQYVAVLYKDKAVLYGRDLSKLWEETELSGESNVIVTEGGNLYTAGVYSAKSYKNLTH